MKKFAVREVETLKTTAALYDCGCSSQPACDCPWWNPACWIQQDQ